jgi:hypothetical protein
MRRGWAAPRPVRTPVDPVGHVHVEGAPWRARKPTARPGRPDAARRAA